MIPLKLQLILFLFSLLTFLLLLNMIKKQKIELKYTLLWLLLSFTSILLSIFPKITYKVSKILSIETPVNTLFLFSIIGSFLIIFSLTVAMSRNSNKIKDLSQEVGLIKEELLELKSKTRNKMEK